MSTTLSDLQTRLAYRLGEDSAPTDTNEVARRLSFINEAYRKVLSEGYFWFLKTIGSQSSVANQEIYTLPSGYRDMVELRLNRKIVVPIPEEDALGTYNYPPLYYQYRSISKKYYVYGDQELHLLPVPDTTPSTLTVSSITRSSTTGTITTSTAHGLEVGDYILIAGADQSGYNGTFRIQTVPSTTTFTITVSSSTTTPATGTITAVWQNIVYRYWSYYTALASDSDTILIPDQFSDVLVAYAYGRYGYIDDTRANSVDGFEEYNNILKDIISENNRRELWGKQQPTVSPDYHYE